jgi:hypothetical protein
MAQGIHFHDLLYVGLPWPHEVKSNESIAIPLLEVSILLMLIGH